MAFSSSRRGGDRGAPNAWPIWVDALSSLLMVVIFVLMVFVVAQVYLSSSLSGRDQALQQLNRQLAELGELLAMERRANEDLRVNIGQISAELQASTAEREILAATLAQVKTERDALQGRLNLLSGRAERTGEDAVEAGRQLEDAYKVIEADRETIALQLREIASLQADLQVLREARRDLEGQVAALAAQAEEGRRTAEERDRLLSEMGTLRDRSRELEARVATEQEKTMLAQREIEQRDIRIADLLRAVDATDAALDEQKRLTAEGQQQVNVLNQQIAALREQLSRLEAALAASEEKSQEQQVQISDLGRRLNLALASKVEELSRYRSEFFGRLREALGNRQNVRVVGDRFVFQSEVLFPTASAVLEPQGREELKKLAATLMEIAATIPPDINWLLRVDGHTDLRPINTSQFPSNWELSTARAIEVVKFLREQGIPAERLAAAGFGEFQPLDPGQTEAAYSRNRRIEIKLDQR